MSSSGKKGKKKKLNFTHKAVQILAFIFIYLFFKYFGIYDKNDLLQILDIGCEKETGTTTCQRL